MMNLAAMSRGGAAALLVWVVVTGALNALLRTRTPAEWEALCEQKPRTAALVRALRAVGVEPQKAISAVIDFLAAQQGSARK